MLEETEASACAGAEPDLAQLAVSLDAEGIEAGAGHGFQCQAEGDFGFDGLVIDGDDAVTDFEGPEGWTFLLNGDDIELLADALNLPAKSGVSYWYQYETERELTVAQAEKEIASKIGQLIKEGHE